MESHRRERWRVDDRYRWNEVVVEDNARYRQFLKESGEQYVADAGDHENECRQSHLGVDRRARCLVESRGRRPREEDDAGLRAVKGHREGVIADQQRFDRDRVDAQAHRSGNEVDRTFRCRRGFTGPEDVDTDEADDDPDPPQQCRWTTQQPRNSVATGRPKSRVGHRLRPEARLATECATARGSRGRAVPAQSTPRAPAARRWMQDRNWIARHESQGKRPRRPRW